MADIDLYLDPVCPFAWVTSRWLLAAAEGGPHRVRLRQMSLAVLNEGREVDAGHRPMIDRSRRIGRLFAAAAETADPDAFARLYETLGRRMHPHRDELDPAAIEESLIDAGFDPELAKRQDYATLDASVARAHEAGQQALGGTGGSPIIVVDGQGFHGPVLTRIPAPTRGSALLEAIVTAATTPGFAVMQRPYQGPPAIDETTEAAR